MNPIKIFCFNTVFLPDIAVFDASLSERSKIGVFPSKKYSQPKKLCVILVTLHGD
jgi:hypothetical protein